MIREGNTFTSETPAEELRERVLERMWRKPDHEYFADTADAVIAIVLKFAVDAIGMENRSGRNWIPDNLWGRITREAQDRVRTLAPKEAGSAQHDG